MNGVKAQVSARIERAAREFIRESWGPAAEADGEDIRTILVVFGHHLVMEFVKLNKEWKVAAESTEVAP